MRLLDDHSARAGVRAPAGPPRAAADQDSATDRPPASGLLAVRRRPSTANLLRIGTAIRAILPERGTSSLKQWISQYEQEQFRDGYLWHTGRSGGRRTSN